MGCEQTTVVYYVKYNTSPHTVLVSCSHPCAIFAISYKRGGILTGLKYFWSTNSLFWWFKIFLMCCIFWGVLYMKTALHLMFTHKNTIRMYRCDPVWQNQSYSPKIYTGTYVGLVEHIYMYIITSTLKN